MKKIYLFLTLLFSIAILTAQVNITFQVDMNYVDEISPDGVHVAGSFQGWDPATTELFDANEDGIYDVTLELIPGDYHEYKYINGNTWAGEEFGFNINRNITVPDVDTILDPVYFADEGPQEYTEQDVTVTFQVNMSVVDEIFDVSLAGTFNDWTPGQDLLDDPDQDFIYTIDYFFPTGTNVHQEYKFLNGANWEEAIENRILTIDDSSPTQILDVVYFNDQNPNDYTTQDVTVTFNCDVADSANAGAIFNTLSINGNVAPLDWDFSAMNNPLTDLGNNIWTIDLLFPSGSWKYLEFKFARNGMDYEAGFGENHTATIDDSNPTQTIDCVYGQMGSAGIEENLDISQPKIFLTNYPNPFRNSTTISFETTNLHENARIEIYNIKGQKVKTLECINSFNTKATESLSHIIWDGTDESDRPVTSGIYFYRLHSGYSELTKKMILME